MATEKSLAAIELVHRAYSKLATMPGGEPRDKLGALAGDAFTTALLMWRNEKMELQPHQVAAITDLRKVMGEDNKDEN